MIFWRRIYTSVRLPKILLVIILLYCAFFVHNGVLRPTLMECRNMVTAHEMVTEGHWLIPTMNAEYRLEKPPLPTWTIAVIETIFGQSLSAQRCASGCMAVLLLVYFYLFVRRLTNDSLLARVSSLVLMSSYLVVVQARAATWDIYCHAFMMAAIYYIYCLCFEREKHWRHVLLAGLMLGLSFLSKGPIAFYALLLPCLLSFIPFDKLQIRGRWHAVSMALLLCIVIGGWWYLYVWIHVPDDMTRIAGKETNAWQEHSVKPWWYYWSFFCQMGVWAPFLIIAIVGCFRQWWAKKGEITLPQCFAFQCLLWLLIAVVLVSLFPAKKMRYLLPLMIPSAMLVGQWILQHRAIKVAYAVVAVMFLLELVGLPLFQIYLHQKDRRSLTEIRTLTELHSLPFYCVVDSTRSLRMEMVYATGHHITIVPFENLEDTLGRHPHCIVFSDPKHYPACLQGMHVVGTFDDNQLPDWSPIYEHSLCNKVWVVGSRKE